MNVTTPIGDHFPAGEPFPNPSDAARITALEARFADAERRIAQLERDSVEKTQWPWRIVPNPVIDPIALSQTCQVCGLRFEGAMGYVCGHTLCPSRITCSAETPYTTTTDSDCGSVSTAIAGQFSSIAQLNAWQRGCPNPTDWSVIPRNRWPEEYKDGSRGYPSAEIPIT